jgi:hypothetical protein
MQVSREARAAPKRGELGVGAIAHPVKGSFARRQKDSVRFDAR